MNISNIYIEIQSNYIQLFEYQGFDKPINENEYQGFDESINENEKCEEIVELKVSFWSSSLKKKYKNICRLILWSNCFSEYEIYYWSLFPFYSSLNEKQREESFYRIKHIPLIVVGSLDISDSIDVEEDLFYSKIILEEEIILEPKDYIIRNKDFRLFQILNIKERE